MITENIKKRLKANWGDKANALDCYAEVKLIDPLLSTWVCYIFAMNESEDQIHCLFYSNVAGLEICIVDTNVIHSMYNEEGEPVVIDTEFRRTKVTEILRRIQNDTR